MTAAVGPPRTLADLHARVSALADIPPERILLDPMPGTATEDDLLLLTDARDTPCELLDGTLVAKACGCPKSLLVGYLITFIGPVVRERNLGVCTGGKGPYRLAPGRVRMPDVAYASWDRFPGRRRSQEQIWGVAPDLVVEVLSPANTAGEMRGKRDDYFAAGTRLVWEVDLEARSVAVFTRPDAAEVLAAPAVLDGGAVLPGFAVPLAELFGELDRHG